MYLARLHRYNAKLNNVVTFLDDVGLAEAQRADAEIAAGKYKGPLHGIPWGAKDIISVKGYKTTWGSPAFKEQSFDYDASVVEMLRDAGAVLIAKLTTGELASGDNWFGGQTKSPWDPGAGIERIVGGSVVGDRRRMRRLRHRHRDQRIDSEPVGALRARRPAADVRPHQPLRRDGAVVDAGSPRPDLPLRGGLRDRHAGDRQAGRPRHERVGHPVQLERAARRQEAARRLHQGVVRRADQRDRRRPTRSKALETLRTIGVSQFVPITVPEMFANNVGGLGVESAVFFDEHARAGRMKEARGGGRPNGRLIPAVEYLQSQRVRMMMMMKLAEATANVDVYIVASNNTERWAAAAAAGAPRERPRRTHAGRDAAGRRAAASADADAAPLHDGEPRVLSGDQRAERLRRNRVADQRDVLRPAVRRDGAARAGQAYQDAAQFHLKRPTALDT